MEIHYSESFWKFLRSSDCRVAKLLVLAQRAEWGYEHFAYNLYVTNKNADYFTLRRDGTISYLPAGKEHIVNEDSTWNRKNRQNGKAAKVIRKLLSKNALKLLKDSDFELFTNSYKAESNEGKFKFSLLPNTKIPSVYQYDRRPGGGSLNDSCMNKEDEDWFEIYYHCPALQILVLKDDEHQLAGRALIWTVDNRTIMDRIYVSEDFLYEYFLDYAEEHGWYRKRHYKSYDYKTEFISPTGEQVSLPMTVYTRTEFDNYPYIDTFSFGNHGYLTNVDDSSERYEYSSAGGDRNQNDDWQDPDEVDDDEYQPFEEEEETEEEEVEPEF